MTWVQEYSNTQDRIKNTRPGENTRNAPHGAREHARVRGGLESLGRKRTLEDRIRMKISGPALGSVTIPVRSYTTTVNYTLATLTRSAERTKPANGSGASLVNYASSSVD